MKINEAIQKSISPNYFKQKIPRDSAQTLKENTVYVLDMLTLLRTITGLPETFEGLA